MRTGQIENPEARTIGSRSRSSFPWRTAGSGALFLLIPIIFVIAVCQLTIAKGPQWLPYTFENPYNYLFNSLLLLKGDAPYSVDHPGTTTQVFGATILRASSLKSNGDLIEAVLREPEKYIRLLHWALLIFSGLVLWLAPWLTSTLLKSPVTGLLIQAPSLFYSSLLWYGILFGPDLMLVPFSIAAICCCTLLIVPSGSGTRAAILLGIGHEPHERHSRLIPALTGLICALGIVTKLTFFPLILISLFCCRSKRNLSSFTIPFIIGLAIAVLPIYSRLPQLATWILGLGIHSGRYDSGAIGLPQSSVYLLSLSNLVQAEPLIVIIPIVSTIVVSALYFAAKIQSLIYEIGWQTALVLFAVQAISLLAIAKESGLQYLIPLSLTTGLNLILLYQACRIAKQLPLKKAVAGLALLGLIGLGLKSFVEETPETYAQLAEKRSEQLRLYRRAQEITKSDVRVDYFFSDSPVYPLCYGNDWAGGAFGSILSDLYPDKLFFDVLNGRFQTFTQSIEPEEIRKKYDHLYFLGSPKWFPKVNGFEADQFETLDQAGDYSLQKWTRK